MLSVMLDVEIVDENGDTTWAQMKLAPIDDPERDYIDVSLPYAPSESDNVMCDPTELRRALDVLARERGIVEGVAA
jgi:hypothetical protein